MAMRRRRRCATLGGRASVGIRVDLSDLPIVDDHGHPFLTDPWTVSHETFLHIFTEGRARSTQQPLVHGGYYQRALHGMAKELQTEPDLPSVLDARRRRGSASARDMIATRRIHALPIRTGLPTS